jgi:branched-chain amino acid transport system permease protein
VLGILVVQLVFFPMPIGASFSGLIIGLLGSLGAIGLALVWRSNRVVNFAQGDLGVFPATLAVLLITVAGCPGWSEWSPVWPPRPPSACSPTSWSSVASTGHRGCS